MKQRATKQFAPRPLFLATMAALIGMAAIPGQAGFDIPTGGAGGVPGTSSPLFAAQPFTQQILLFEEFGTQPLPTTASPHQLPDPGACNGAVDPATFTGLLDTFLSQPIWPAPQEQANTTMPNPLAARLTS